MNKVFLILLSVGVSLAQNDFLKPLDPDFWKIVPQNSKIEQIATGFQFTEGPVWSKSGFLLFSDIPANVIYKIDEKNRVTEYLSPSQNSNGLSFDAGGQLIICQHATRCVVSKNTKTGQVTTLASSFRGRKLNSPNDVVSHPKGIVFFTDPPYGLPNGDDDTEKELSFSGIYRLYKGQLRLIDSSLRRPNGIALSPDYKKLYVAQSEFEWLWNVYDLDANAQVISKSLFYKGEQITGNPDGIKTDMKGNVYCTGNHGVIIFSKEGKMLGTIVFPENTTNLCWGGKKGNELYVTAQKSVYRIVLNATGFITY